MAVTSNRVVDCSPELFAKNFNSLPHEVQHNLSTNSLFQLPALAELAQRVAARERPHHPMGDIHILEGTTESKSSSNSRREAKTRASELIAKIEQGQTWIILKHIEREPGYKEVFEDCISDIVQLAGKQLLKQVKWFEAMLFITSPNRVTDYHIDRECSWLFQIQGNKEIHLFDRADKDVLPDEELEQYWMGNNLASAYKPQFESRAIVYQLRPGVGVHSPVNTPHWLQNGDNVSISLNINFQFHEAAWENLFRANHYLRRAGLTPSSPGKNPLADNAKRHTYTALQDMRRLVKRQPRVPPTEARQQYHQIVKMLTSR
jgi:hypothetical protein